MRKFIALALIALAATACAVAPADAAAKWVTKQITWSAGADTTFLQDETDTTRTDVVTTSDWDWEVLAPSGDNAVSGVVVTFVADVSNLASDSLNYTVERSFAGLFERQLPPGATLVTAHAVGNCAPSFGTPGSGGGTASSKVFQGYLVADKQGLNPGPIAAGGVANIWAVPQFRLHVTGDISGTTPALSGLRVYITYPQKQ